MLNNAPKVEIGKHPNLYAQVISSSWHPEICQSLIDGAVKGLKSVGVEKIKISYVAGSFELPLAAQLALDKGADLVVVVGLVLRGETPHFDYICQGVTKGVMDVSLSRSKPVGFGVLMCDDLSQAVARAGGMGSKEDKGFDAAIAALTLLNN
jgi:6,7-dimethyl-8-ribityllumazine synthase